jgi:hypothetical protein
MRCEQCGKKATQKSSDPYFNEMPDLLDEGVKKMKKLGGVMNAIKRGYGTYDRTQVYELFMVG